jgi:hypothetical protein
MSYARLSRRPLLFKSFTGLEITEFDIISKEIESKYHEHESVFPTGKEKESKFRYLKKGRIMVLFTFWFSFYQPPQPLPPP